MICKNHPRACGDPSLKKNRFPLSPEGMPMAVGMTITKN